MKVGKRGFVLVGVLIVVLIVVIAAFAIINYTKFTGGVSWPVDSNRKFLASTTQMKRLSFIPVDPGFGERFDSVARMRWTSYAA